MLAHAVLDVRPRAAEGDRGHDAGERRASAFEGVAQELLGGRGDRGDLYASGRLVDGHGLFGAVAGDFVDGGTALVTEAAGASAGQDVVHQVGEVGPLGVAEEALDASDADGLGYVDHFVVPPCWSTR